jgi:predicted transcriptional regulator
MKAGHELRLLTAFRAHPVLTFDEIGELLEGVSEATARRALRGIPYRSSYNHNGRYYTLFEESKFDRWGLWSYEGVRVSRDGSLTATVERLVRESEAGWTRRELGELLGVSVQTVLTTLRERGKVDRARVGPAYVYVSAGSAAEQLERRQQMTSLKQRRSEAPLGVVVAVLLVLIRHPKSTAGEVVRRLKGHSPPIHLEDVEEVFERYDLAQKRGLLS